MAWEVFDGARRGFNARLSIRSSGAIAFNAGAIRELELKKGTFAQLLYDKERGKIGIKLDKNGELKNVFNLSVRNDRSAWISAKSFFRHYKIDLPEPGKANALRFGLEREEEMIVIDYPGKRHPENPGE